MDLSKPVVCPRCNDIMKRTTVKDFENKDLEFDYCLGCSGVFFDDGELERVLKAPSNLPIKVLNIPHYKDLYETKPEGERICGRCSALMYPRQIASLNVDVCRECLSIYLDGGELSALLEPYAKQAVQAHISDKVSHKPQLLNNKYEAKLKCPNCQFLFRKMEVQGHSGIFNLDFCTGCTGVWFDGGELEELYANNRRMPVKLCNLARALEDDEITERTNLCPRCSDLFLTKKNIYGIEASVCKNCEGVFIMSNNLFNLFSNQHINFANILHQD